MKSLLFILCLVWLWNCGTGGSNANTLTITTETETAGFTVELAQTAQERQQGLMGRTSLEERHGMLFIFPALSMSSFWMKDTPLSLDIIFIGENLEIQEIFADTTPNSEDLITPSQPYLYVLEVAAGTAASLGIEVGNSITLPN